MPSQVRRLKQFEEEENRRIKQMVAYLSLDKEKLKDVLSKKPYCLRRCAALAGRLARRLPGLRSGELALFWWFQKSSYFYRARRSSQAGS